MIRGTKTFTITGNNTIIKEMYYNISLIVTSNTFSSGALKYKLISANTDGNGTIIPSKTTMQYIGYGASEIIIGNGSFTGPTMGNKIHTYNLEIYFPDTGKNQNEDQGKQISAYIKVTEGNVVLPFNEEKGVNRPELITGMTPIIYNTETLNWDATTEDNPNWYDYNTKKWANAMTEDGLFWVWIPRYAYKMTHINPNGIIEIKFLKEKSNDSIDDTLIETSGYDPNTKNTSTNYFLHPAFVYGEDQLTGIWVAKFEASNDGNDNIIIAPNKTSWRNINMSNMFYNSQAMKNKTSIYGWNETDVDSHLMKNIEWGAVAYLSKSIYASDANEVWNNAYNGYRTGCSGSGVDAANESTCVTYETVNGQKASTTHNIYGIYDMSGGAWEYVMANYDNIKLESGFTDLFLIHSKYIDRYYNAENYDIYMYGDAIYETGGNVSGSAGWFGDYSGIPTYSSPWFIRGGRWINDTSAGLFAFYDTDGDSYDGGGFRVVLATFR